MCDVRMTCLTEPRDLLGGTYRRVPHLGKSRRHPTKDVPSMDGECVSLGLYQPCPPFYTTSLDWDG